MKWTVVVVILLLAACSSQGEEAPPEPVALVALAPVREDAIAETTILYGVAEDSAAARQALHAPTEAILVAVEAPVGTQVVRGQVIARLTPSPASRLDLAKAEADAQATEEVFARAKRLRTDGLVSDAEVETARAAARSASATRASLGARADALALRARASGFVEAIGASPGDLVAPGTAVATISSPGDLRARFGADPAIVRRIAPGSSIRIAPSGGGNAFSVPILATSPVVDPQTRLASLFAPIPTTSRIGPGEALTGEVRLRAGAPGVSIPYAALLDEGGQPYVFVVEKGIAHQRPVSTGPSSGDRIAVTRGVKPGETVVVAGGTALSDGMKVRTR